MGKESLRLMVRVSMLVLSVERAIVERRTNVESRGNNVREVGVCEMNFVKQRLYLSPDGRTVLAADRPDVHWTIRHWRRPNPLQGSPGKQHDQYIKEKCFLFCLCVAIFAQFSQSPILSYLPSNCIPLICWPCVPCGPVDFVTVFH